MEAPLGLCEGRFWLETLRSLSSTLLVQSEYMGFENVQSDSELASTPESGVYSNERVEVLRDVANTVQFDACLHFSLGIQDGELFYTCVDAIGEQGLVDTLGSFDGRSSICQKNWDPEYPYPGTANEFVSYEYSHADLRSPDDPMLELFADHDIRSIVRMITYEDETFAGAIVGFRCGSRGFSPSEMRELSSIETEVRDRLVSIEQERVRSLDNAPAYALFVRQSPPSVDAFSPGANRWLDEKRVKYVRRWIDIMHGLTDADSFTGPAIRQSSDRADRWRGLLEGFEVRLTDLEGSDNQRALVRIEHVDRPRLGVLAPLTPRQREVAREAATGHTNREIAEILDITPDTVGDHLSAIYDRLNLSNRVELANTLKD